MDTRASKDGHRAEVARQGAGANARQGAETLARPGPTHAEHERGATGTRRDGNSRIERLCIERGLKMTGQRRLIARVLSDSADHPDVEELYRRAVAQDNRISIATVYRTVRLLEEKGILERRDFGGNRARYDQADRGHHYHLIDVDSGKVIEFADPRHETLAREIAERLGFELVEHRLELFGRRLDATAGSRGARTALPDGGTAPDEAGPQDAG